MNRFQDKTVIITGAGSGLGRTAAERLGTEGANLVLVDIDTAALDTTKQLIESAGGAGRVITKVANVADEADVRSYVQAAVDEFDTIDGFFNNAGIEGRQRVCGPEPVDPHSAGICRRVRGDRDDRQRHVEHSGPMGSFGKH